MRSNGTKASKGASPIKESGKAEYETHAIPARVLEFISFKIAAAHSVTVSGCRA